MNKVKIAITITQMLLLAVQIVHMRYSIDITNRIFVYIITIIIILLTGLSLAL